jgi:hypothetical protein
MRSHTGKFNYIQYPDLRYFVAFFTRMHQLVLTVHPFDRKLLYRDIKQVVRIVLVVVHDRIYMISCNLFLVSHDSKM